VTAGIFTLTVSVMLRDLKTEIEQLA